MESLNKVKTIFKSHAVASIVRWSACVHRPMLLICALNVADSLMSLGIPLVTKGMIDGATSADSSALWRNGILLAALIIIMNFVVDIAYKLVDPRINIIKKGD